MNIWVVLVTIGVNAVYYVRTGFLTAAPTYIQRSLDKAAAKYENPNPWYLEIRREFAETEAYAVAAIWPIYLAAVPVLDWMRSAVKGENLAWTAVDILQDRDDELYFDKCRRAASSLAALSDEELLARVSTMTMDEYAASRHEILRRPAIRKLLMFSKK